MYDKFNNVYSGLLKWYHKSTRKMPGVGTWRTACMTDGTKLDFHIQTAINICNSSICKSVLT
jgi:hypothetical protein